jgi:hypothetical protein
MNHPINGDRHTPQNAIANATKAKNRMKVSCKAIPLCSTEKNFQIRSSFPPAPKTVAAEPGQPAAAVVAITAFRNALRIAFSCKATFPGALMVA